MSFQLALDVGLCRLVLGIERVEVLVEPVIGGLPGIDGATKHLPLVLSATAHLRHLSTRLEHSKKAPHTPLCPRDGPRDARKASMSAPVPDESIGDDGHMMGDPLPFAHQNGPGPLELRCWSLGRVGFTTAEYAVEQSIQLFGDRSCQPALNSSCLA